MQDDMTYDLDDEDEPQDPYEIGTDANCSCALCYVNCDATEQWCHYHNEFIEALRNLDAKKRSARCGN